MSRGLPFRMDSHRGQQDDPLALPALSVPPSRNRSFRPLVVLSLHEALVAVRVSGPRFLLEHRGKSGRESTMPLRCVACRPDIGPTETPQASPSTFQPRTITSADPSCPEPCHCQRSKILLTCCRHRETLMIYKLIISEREKEGQETHLTAFPAVPCSLISRENTCAPSQVLDCPD